MKSTNRRRVSITAVAAIIIAVLAFPVLAEAASALSGAQPQGQYATYTKKKSTKKRVTRKRVTRKRVRRVVYRNGRRRVIWVYVSAAAPAPAPAPVVAPIPAAAPIDQQAEADAVLAGLKALYPRFLDGVTVTVGDTPGGYQAVCYYSSGSIVVNPNHTATMTAILTHEIWHVIDWRDNGCIDWRESIPPANAADFRG